MTTLAVEQTLADSKALLYARRQERLPPLLDDKILTAWNGLMISAFAVAARTFDDPGYGAQAAAAAEFLWRRLRPAGRLARSYRAGSADEPAVLEDYAFLTAALLDLYETSGEPRWLLRARELQSELDAHYAAPRGGYYRTADDGEALLARELPASDGAEPSGNSVAALDLLRLAELTNDDGYRATADRLLKSFAVALESPAPALTDLLLAVEFRHARVLEIVIVAPSRDAAAPFLEVMRRRFAPHQVLVVADQASLAEHSRVVPLLEGKKALDGLPTAYVCEQGVCQLPTTDSAQFRAQLDHG
jgi:uncharacterized protein YyaL (SSP411 family)